ncbi:HalOD1 output domain-containing protein [Haloarcula laminariae]|uniref:HalOD1 output domain-containing protein n=1 Tax=Haloarcula laminariae TaxID=2961577 RepID=UPI0024069A22|nr:HalOD1 output domain-containing protein [Halomicroarcula sp. FL173]
MTQGNPPQSETEPQPGHDRQTRAAAQPTADGESICYRVLTAVAEATGTAPTDLAPLSETVEPDALEQLFTPTGTETSQSAAGSVAFRYEGCIVTVYADGRVTVEHAES